AITLIITLLEHGLINRCLVIVPSSLVDNWRNEFVQWIGELKTQRFVMTLKSNLGRKRNYSRKRKPHVSMAHCSNATNKNPMQTQEALADQLRTFHMKNGKSILIVGYEMFRKYYQLIKMKPKTLVPATRSEGEDSNVVDLIVCDEGHRLKNKAGNQTMDALDAMNTPRKIIITGTPIQNNLSELYTMCNIVNPGILGCDYRDFQSKYGKIIEKSRDTSSEAYDKHLGDCKSKELNSVLNDFILQRSNDLLMKYLPIKDEFIVFHSISRLQQDLYTQLLSCAKMKPCMEWLEVESAHNDITSPIPKRGMGHVNKKE
ncbi:DNA repair and recombination protein RAD54, partial [Reticulomyxa filosa]